MQTRTPAHECPNAALVAGCDLDHLPKSQAEPVRHRCVACAFAKGREIAARPQEEVEQLLRDATEQCPHGFVLPDGVLAGLPRYQGGDTRHLCAGCAFVLGLQSMRPAPPSSPFEPDAARRIAIERHSMELARKELKRAGAIEIYDRSLYESFDFECVHQGKRRVVEVKGTTGRGDEFLATRAEVDLAGSEAAGTWLIVVCDISFPQGAAHPTGGRVRSFPHWRAEQVEPIQFKCWTAG